MEQIRSRKAIQDEGAEASRAGMDLDDCPYAAGTEARDEWENGYCQACARAVVANAAAIRVAA